MNRNFKDLKNDLMELYSEETTNLNFKHMNKLFPDIKEGCINFGYWDSKEEPLSLMDRIHSQKNLYNRVFSKLSLSQEHFFLEVGCGRGHGVNWLNQRKIKCYGIDAFEKHINKSKSNYPFLKNNFYLGIAEKIPFESNVFDGVFSIEAAQHFFSFKSFVNEVYRILKKGGRACLSTYFFNSESCKKLVKKYIPTTVEGTHNAISITQALKVLKDCNFKIEEVERIGNKVFPSYATWQQQEFQNRLELKSMASNKDWEDYYIGGSKNKEHPWLTVYKKEYLDYFIIMATKQ